MTLKAIVIGLLGGLVIACAGTMTEQRWDWGQLTAGHLLPIVVFGMLPLGMVLINPLLRRFARWASFRPAEVAIIVALSLVGCSIPGGGLMRVFSQTLALPAHHNLTSPGWRKNRLLSYVPPSMFPAEGKHHDVATDGFVSGLGSEGHPIGLEQVPWGEWKGPLVTWVPLVLLSGLAAICLSLIVHRQWVSRERLRYPIAEFANSLIDQDEGSFGPIFRNKMFWAGFAIIAFIRLVNGLNAWFPDKMISIPLIFNFWSVSTKFPSLLKAPMGGDLLFIFIVPVAIAFSFFLASDIALSLGLTQLIVVPITALLITQGIDISSTYMAGGATAWQRFGSFTAFALILLYIGRRYYLEVLKQALTFRRRPEVEPYAAWACRILILVVAAMIVIMRYHLGLNLPIAVLFVLMILVMFLVTARITAETGLFWIMPRWMPMGVLLAMFGAFALGPQAIIVLGLLSLILCIDTGESLMPYLINALKICDRVRVKPSKVGWGAVGVFAVGVAIAVPAGLWTNYNFGTKQDLWGFKRVSTMTFRVAKTAVTEIDQADKLDASVNLDSLQRIMNITPNRKFLWSVGIGVALVLVVGALRLRYSWWPLHPVIFLVWASWPMVRLNWSFLFGWMLKVAVTRLGGHRAYSQTKALMIGVVAAELLAGLIFMAVAGIYYATTGRAPVIYSVFP